MQDTIQSRNQFIKAISQRGVIIAGIILLGVGSAMTYRWMRVASNQQEADAPVITPVIETVTALGRLEPRGTVIKLSAPTSSQGNRVERLLVQEGDRIQVGQVIAILDSHDQRKAALEEAEEQVNVARTQLDVIQAGAKQGEINAQRAEIARLSAERQGNIAAQVATVARLQSELQNAQAEFNRYQLLYQEGAISASERDSRRLALDTAQKSVQEAQVNLDRLRLTTPAELNRARATLEQIAEVRPVDVRSAQAQVNRAIAARNQAKASFEQSVVRSPIDGEVLDIYTRAGEVVSTDGIAEIGQTQQMQAIAEVYQSDISKVQVGQRVRVTSDSIASELTGTVEWVGSQVRRQAIVNTDPSANIDARVIEVQINLDDASSQKAAQFTNLQVQVVIESPA
ncbi:ABC exporter membrane fusion protein [Gloeocapsopsis sp. IPPAS B-1203]|uniref:ABC exporter membrane fusion protein n=1 Tax=Gloeocapsopsis sp. IPPAS B-1203 TaxID=2049454 RepID=UPI000C18A2B1|nr:ABC exporter membrane fusion protein [Gloeocapsopsis sp. IPPAS B-1203]PIG91465.1 HlyD family secretion protein [Gloeocapsopsis sp. IPPAS B-1203]